MKLAFSIETDDTLHAYCAVDSLSTTSVWYPLYADARDLQGFDVTPHFHERTMPLAREVLRMQKRGMPFSLEVSRLVEADLLKEVKKLEQKVRRLMGPDFRLSADSDMIAFIHGTPEDGGLGMKVHKRTEKTQRAKMDEETVRWYQAQCERPEVIRKIGADQCERLNSLIDYRLDWKELHDLTTEYVQNPRQRVRDGRMYCRLLIHVVPTTRLACREPNLQNQPKRCNPVLGKRIRNQYDVSTCAPLKKRVVQVGPLDDPGPLLQVHDALMWQVWVIDHWEFWEQDLQAAEKRIAYIESGDTLGLERLAMYDKLIKQGKHDEALRWECHRCNALDAFGPFGLKFEDITTRLRDFMKNVSYGEGYGGKAETMNLPPDLLKMLHTITGLKGRDAVKGAMDNYRAKHPQEAQYRADIEQKIRASRMLVDPSYGTVRFFFGHIDADVRAGLNDPCQRGVARILNETLLSMRSESWAPMKRREALMEQMDHYMVRSITWQSGVKAAIPTEFKRSAGGWGDMA